MKSKDRIIAKHKEKIQKLSEELAEELLRTEPDLEKRFTSFDAEVHKILTEVGNSTMEIIGSNLSGEVKKKPLKKD